jgi:hypothetical protein
MKLTFLTLLTGAFVLGISALPTAYSGTGLTAEAGGWKPPVSCWRCKKCDNKDCRKAWSVYKRDEFIFIAQSNCLICVSQYSKNCKVRG